MDVHRPAWRNLEHRLRKDLAVGHDQQDLRPQVAQRLHDGLLADAPGLEHADTPAFGHRLDRRRFDPLAAALLAVGLGDEGQDLVAREKHRLERWDREIARAEKDEPHLRLALHHETIPPSRRSSPAS